MRALSLAARALALTLGFYGIGACALTLDSQEGNRLSLYASAATWIDADHAGWLQLENGREIVLSQAEVIWARFRLVPCEGARVQTAPSHLVPLARAHVIGDPLRFEGALRESSLEAPEEPLLATLHIPDGTYCHLTVGADRGTEGFSLLFEGVSRLPGGEWEPFRFEETAAFNLELTLETPVVRDGRKLHIEIQKDPSHWFEGLSFAPGAARDDARALLRALSASSQVVLR